MPSLRAQLEAKIQERHLLSHSFYVRWQAGQLSREELQGYAKEYFAFEREFPRYLSSLHSHCEDQKTRQRILDNLIHEEQGDQNHSELWLRFAEGLGVSRSDAKNHFHNDETEHLLKTFRKYAMGGDLVEGLAALHAYEKQQPDVARSKMEGLRTHYNWQDEDSLAFFKEHQHYDVIHADTEASILTELCESEKDIEKAVAVTDAITEALYEFLSGIERRYRPTEPAEGYSTVEDAWEAMTNASL